jgi:hypothetical protein
MFSLTLSFAALGPVSTRYGFPSGNPFELFGCADRRFCHRLLRSGLFADPGFAATQWPPLWWAFCKCSSAATLQCGTSHATFDGHCASAAPGSALHATFIGQCTFAVAPASPPASIVSCTFTARTALRAVVPSLRAAPLSEAFISTFAAACSLATVCCFTADGCTFVTSAFARAADLCALVASAFAPVADLRAYVASALTFAADSCALVASACVYTAVLCAVVAPAITFPAASCALVAPACVSTAVLCAVVAPAITFTAASCALVAPACVSTTVLCAVVAPAIAFTAASCTFVASACVSVADSCAVGCAVGLGLCTISLG